MTEPLLEVENLRVIFKTGGPPARAVDGVSLKINAGQIVALVGESGCGKSVLALALARLVPAPPGIISGGRIRFRGREVLPMSAAALRHLRGAGIAYIFQEPSVALNPVWRIGAQIAEALRLHQGARAAGAEVLRLLRLVGFEDPERQQRAYAHELSGGLQQRAMIAMALAARPALLVADEPTTALDVTIQAQIMELLARLRQELGMAMLLITHNLGLVAGLADWMHVMYAGQIVESGAPPAVLSAPQHPYTRGLLAAVPRLDGSGPPRGLAGVVPPATHWPSGCRFHPRCGLAREICRGQLPELVIQAEGRAVRCWRSVADPRVARLFISAERTQ
ncbi:MAG: ABC transporter ATP-binding protein [Lentisphaerae bacterium]|nr:ABC transporter ATP-binding protein [Lentisphaerota bacterium]